MTISDLREWIDLLEEQGEASMPVNYPEYETAGSLSAGRHNHLG